MADEKPETKVGMDFLIFFIVIGAMFTLWVQGGGPMRAKEEGLIKDSDQTSRQSQTSRTQSSGGVQSGAGADEAVQNRSPYYGQVRISASSVRPTSANSEYITLTARGNKEPINIGNWILKNGRDQKFYNISGTETRGQSVSVRIPALGVVKYNPYLPATNIQSPITLADREKAVIITGQVPTLADFVIRDNFKLNRCLGYLEDKTSYRFSPTIRDNCPRSEEFPGVDNLSDTCAKFASSVRACHEPKETYDPEEGYCLDRNCSLNSFCKGFVQQTFNFQSCFNTFSRDADFVGDEWRIFLGRTWELWESRREVITLYDASGRLVHQIEY